MKIAVVASGTRGDVQPYVALGKGLRAAGHNVRVLTSDDFESLVKNADLEFHSIGTSIERMLQSDEWTKTLEQGNFLTILARMQAEMKRRARQVTEKMPVGLDGAEIILAGMAGWGGPFSIAEKLRIPIIQTYVLPVTPTRAFPSPLTPSLPFGRVLNRLSFHTMRQMLWQSVRIADVTARKYLDMPSASFWGPFRPLKRRGIPVLYGYSQHVLPRPDDWDSHHYVTGYWFLETAPDWSPPDSLSDFLRAGPPPVYIGFGSMSSRKPEEATALALKALARSGQRGVLASGWGGLSPTDLPNNVYMLSSAPHTWLFPHMAAVVHHGGAGTTAAGLWAGVPSIIVPFMGDQPFWGQRVAKLGVGTRPIPRRRLTAERLADAISQTVSDVSMRQRAAALGDRIRAENGILQAVSLIESLAENLPAGLK